MGAVNTVSSAISAVVNELSRERAIEDCRSSTLISLSCGQLAVLFSYTTVVLLIAIAATSCRGPASLEQRYEQATAALRHGKLQEARRLATFRVKHDSAWNAKFRILEAEVI